MSVSYEAFLMRGCMLEKSFAEYVMAANMTDDEATDLYEKWVDNENLFFNYYRDTSNEIFGYKISQTWDPTEETFTAVPVKMMDIDAAKEHNLEQEFYKTFGEYPPHFTTLMVMRAC